MCVTCKLEVTNLIHVHILYKKIDPYSCKKDKRHGVSELV